MKIRYFTSFMLLYILSTAANATFWIPRGPYLETTVGGTTYQAQTTHQTIFSTLILGRFVLQNTDIIYTRVQQNNSLDLVTNVAVGFNFNPYIRGAVALSYFKVNLYARNYGLLNNSTSYSQGQTWLYTANLYLDLRCLLCFRPGPLNPYIGIGLGGATNHLDTQSAYIDNTIGVPISSRTRSATNINFAYKAMAGINYMLNNNLELSLQYAFVHAGEYLVGNAGFTSIGSTFVVQQRGKFIIYANQLTGGLIYNFDC